MSEINFGVELKRGNGASPEVFTAVAALRNITPPELEHVLTEATDHSSTDGYAQWKATGKKTLAEFTITIAYVWTDATHNASTGLIADVVAGAVHNWQIVFPDSAHTTWTIPAIVKKFTPGGMDALNPELMLADVTFQPSGKPTLA
jgi:hypothetical protein